MTVEKLGEWADRRPAQGVRGFPQGNSETFEFDLVPSGAI